MPLPPGEVHDQRSPRERRWGGRLLSPVEEVRMFFQDQGPVPETFKRLRKLLAESGLAHIFVGATAVNAHGFRRSTEDVDLCMRAEDLERFRQLFVGSTFQPVEGRTRRFYDPQTQVTLDILVAGEIAGNRRKQQVIRFPDPSEAIRIEDTPVPSLPRLIELKLVTWRYQDWGDVVNLIRARSLDESFADQLHPIVRWAYLQCYDQKIEEDRYNPEIHDGPPGN
ncbi:MAG: hypothetical protein AB1716_03160 [Planctomycetota bacterium]